MGFFNRWSRSGRLPAAVRGKAGARAYAIGDVHGRLDLLERILADIEADAAARRARRTFLVFLGDLIDRGPASAAVVERLRTYAPGFATPVFLAGNHEEVMLRVLGGEEAILADWLTFGGAECLQSYGLDPDEIAVLAPKEAIQSIRAAVPKTHADFLAGFVDSFRFGDYLFVHAGIRPGVELDEQDQFDLRWIREPFLSDEEDHGFVVVHGHTIASAVDERPNRIGIDTGAYRSGVLTALCIEEGDRWFLSTSEGSLLAD